MTGTRQKLEAILRELVKLPHGREVLCEAGRLELRVLSSQIITFEESVCPHPATQQSAAQCSVAQGHDVVRAAVRENCGFDGSFEEVVR